MHSNQATSSLNLTRKRGRSVLFWASALAALFLQAAPAAAAEMLDFVDTPGQLVVLTGRGRAFVAQSPEDRKTTWREQLLTLRLFREIDDVLRGQPERSIDREFVLETIVTRMPYENYEKVFNTFVRWSRFGELFTYDEAAQRITLTSA